MRERIERGVSFAIGLISVLALRPATPPPAAPIVIRAPVPVPITAVQAAPVMLPTVVAAVPEPQVDGCPSPPMAEGDAPIGRAASEAERPSTYGDPDGLLAVAASPAVGVIAAIDRYDGAIVASTDDGRRFRPIFRGRTADQVAVDDRGRIYAIGGDGLLVRDADGRERRAEVACEHETCTDRLVAIPGGVAWIHDHEIEISRDGARRWRTLDRDDATELAMRERIVALGGTLWGTTHVSEECGWDADEVTSIDLATGRYRDRSFDNEEASPALAIVDDRGASWRYRALRTPAGDLDALLVGRLTPTVGGRALRIDDGTLVELCGARARVVAHDFRAERIDAVDAAGRPLVVRGGALLRWSPAFGWRVLYEAPARDGGGD